MLKSYCIILIMAFLTGCASGGPLAFVPNGSEVDSMTAAPIHLFRHYLSGADGHRCPMTPSCSTYALQAVARHGALMGWIMTTDRLLRCGHDELKHSPAVMTASGIRYRDTLDNNDFWWRTP